MTKLADSQLTLLSRASQHSDGMLEDGGSMYAGAAAKVSGALTRKKLMREIRSKPVMPVWQQDEGGRNLSQVITKARRKAIHVYDSSVEENDSGDRSSVALHDHPESKKSARAPLSNDAAPTKQPAGNPKYKSKVEKTVHWPSD